MPFCLLVLPSLQLISKSLVCPFSWVTAQVFSTGIPAGGCPYSHKPIESPGFFLLVTSTKFTVVENQAPISPLFLAPHLAFVTPTHSYSTTPSCFLFHISLFTPSAASSIAQTATTHLSQFASPLFSLWHSILRSVVSLRFLKCSRDPFGPFLHALSVLPIPQWSYWITHKLNTGMYDVRQPYLSL